MNYNNEDNQKMAEIRSGLVQYIGAMLDNTMYKNNAAKQIVCASLLEEAINVCTITDENNITKINLFAAKPILRSAVIILKQRKSDYDEYAGTINDEEMLNQVKNVILVLDESIKLIDSIINGIGENE
jgi:hypothetical protein